MAFDGITIANIRKELDDTLTGGRIFKIAQPEPDELLLTIKITERSTDSPFPLPHPSLLFILRGKIKPVR